MPYLLLVLPLVILVLIYNVVLPPHRKWSILRRRYTMPPGPPGQPVVGSLSEWLIARNGSTMISWLVDQARYGEMTTLSMGTQTWVLLNSSRVVDEIITKRAAITHERPYFPVAGGLVSRNKRTFLKKTDKWRGERRLLHNLIMGSTSKVHGKLVEEASLGLLTAYLDESEAWYAHHYRYAACIMHKIVLNVPLSKSRAELDELQLVTSTFLSSINSSAVDFFPALRHLPRFLQVWRPKWEKMGDFHYRVFKHWWTGMAPVKNINAQSSFVQDLVHKLYPGTDEEAMYLTMLTLVAGSDNPRMTLNAWAMAALSHPDAMARARAELDALCYSGGIMRLPSLEDLHAAPYTAAVVKEVLRWRPTVPLMPQRVLVKDLTFEGYIFPAGTHFLINSIPVCTRGHTRPHEFLPERWLGGADGESAKAGERRRRGGSGVEQDLWQWAFSGGRRSCVGYKLAQKELFVAIARLLFCFDLRPNGAFDDNVLNAFCPGEPFPMRPIVRSAAHERLIRDRAANSEIWGSCGTLAPK
ncbi:cytochrome P450 2C31 [Xylariomycetidae sp. FL2044]|nr:cytochrome P450 2C31 [Xylariomycetidae sp. FL2044]